MEHKEETVKRRASLEIKEPKTRVCIDCGKRKKIENFHWQKPPRNYKLGPLKVQRRTECKQCHSNKSNSAYKKRTTIKERRDYMNNYVKTHSVTFSIYNQFRYLSKRDFLRA